MSRDRDTFDRFQPRERGLFGDNEQVRGNDSVRSNLVDLTLNFHDERPLAICVSDPARAGAPRQWLPKSQIEYIGKARGVVEVTMPEWLAKSKGLL
jgi:hypothetical protein